MFSKSESKAASTELVDLKSDNMSTFSTETNLPPYTEEAPAQSYNIIYKDWKCSRAVVQVPGTNENVYNVELPTFVRAKINLKSAQDNAEIASGNPFCLKKHISANIRGKDLDLRYVSVFKCNYTYTSPAFDGNKMAWSCESGIKSMQYVLQDEQGLPVARWTLSGPSVGPFKDLGRIEFLGTKANSQEAKEEILITGLMAIYVEIWARSNGTLGMSAIGTMVAVGAGSGADSQASSAKKVA